MQLIFDSIDELLDFCRYFRPVEAGQRLEVSELPPLPSIDPLPVLTTAGLPEMGDGEQSAAMGEQSADGTKRKRRAKAEMEAARAAEAAAAVAAGAPVTITVGEQTEADRQARFAPPVTVGAPAAAVVAAGSAVEAAVQGAGPGNPFATVSAVAPVPLPTEFDPTLLAQHAATLGEISPRDHLRRATAFIEKQGHAKYNEVFKLTGTPVNIMAYTPEQVKLHCAALDWADANWKA